MDGRVKPGHDGVCDDPGSAVHRSALHRVRDTRADVMRAKELLALIRAGAVDGLSIGYRTVRGQIDPKSRVRKLYQVDLWEISIVTFPLLNGARVAAVKQTPKLSPQRAAAEAEWRAMLRGEDIAMPRAPRTPLASRLQERAGRKT